MNNKQKLTLIDADSIPYIMAWNKKEEDKISTIEQDSIEFVDTILEKTEADKYLLLFSSKTSFRNELYKEYKTNRNRTTDFRRLMSAIAIEKDFKSYRQNKMEADDLCKSLYEKHKDDYNVTIASPDKDLIQIGCKLYDYRKDMFLEPTKEEAERFYLKQLLMGDPTDNIKGIPGVGEKTAKKLVNELTQIYKFPFQRFSACYAYYLKKINDPIKATQEFLTTLQMITLVVVPTEEELGDRIEKLPYPDISF